MSDGEYHSKATTKKYQYYRILACIDAIALFTNGLKRLGNLVVQSRNLEVG